MTQDYLKTVSAPGLVLLEDDGGADRGDDDDRVDNNGDFDDSDLKEKQQQPAPLVREFGDLIPGAFYALARIDMEEQLNELIGMARHLQQNEFGRALCAELRIAFPSEVRGLGPFISLCIMEAGRAPPPLYPHPHELTRLCPYLLEFLTGI